MSTPSQCGATSFAAARSVSGLLAQNCTSRGRSPACVVKISSRYLGLSTKRRACTMGVYAHVAPYRRHSSRNASSLWSTIGATWNLGEPMLRQKSQALSLFAAVAGTGGTGTELVPGPAATSTASADSEQGGFTPAFAPFASAPFAAPAVSAAEPVACAVMLARDRGRMCGDAAARARDANARAGAASRATVRSKDAVSR
mmetsp:Transcript_11495/g.48188  ORF Transcript_11495/g.48188 Transcript_11495/m.48188 type:complete len:200 (-) Transcript_11495:102-701(-)